MFDKRQIARQFDRSAAHYERYDGLQRLMNDELLKWVSPCNTIADLGCGSGRALARLAELDPGSVRIGVDLASAMLGQARTRDPQLLCLQADMEYLPLADQSVDLVYSCAALQWGNPDKVLLETRRILKPGGKLLLGTLVAGSLAEWHQAWMIAGKMSRVHALPEVDLLMKKLTGAGLQPLRQRRIEHCFSYATPELMLQDLKGLGGTHASADRPRGLLGKKPVRLIYASSAATYGDGASPIQRCTRDTLQMRVARGLGKRRAAHVDVRVARHVTVPARNEVIVRPSDGRT